MCDRKYVTYHNNNECSKLKYPTTYHLYSMFNCRSGCRLLATGQLFAEDSRVDLCSSLRLNPGKCIEISIRPILLGSFNICFVTSTRVFFNSIPKSRAFNAIVVMAHVANETQVISVGENFSPLPLLSVGASVSITVPLCKWVALQRRSPSYIIEAVIVYFYINLLRKPQYIVHAKTIFFNHLLDYSWYFIRSKTNKKG